MVQTVQTTGNSRRKDLTKCSWQRNLQLVLGVKTELQYSHSDLTFGLSLCSKWSVRSSQELEKVPWSAMQAKDERYDLPEALLVMETTESPRERVKVTRSRCGP